MARLPELKPEDFDEATRKLGEKIAAAGATDPFA